MDITQVVIAICLFVITLTIVACFVVIIKLIQDLRRLLNQFTPIIDNATLISSSIARPVSSASDFIMGFKNGFRLFNSFSKNKKED